MLVGQDSAQRSWEGCRGVYRRHLEAEPKPRTWAQLCLFTTSSFHTYVPSRLLPFSMNTAPHHHPRSVQLGWCALRTLA